MPLRELEVGGQQARQIIQRTNTARLGGREIGLFLQHLETLVLLLGKDRYFFSGF
jgi:hypothetical protein